MEIHRRQSQVIPTLGVLSLPIAQPPIKFNNSSSSNLSSRGVLLTSLLASCRTGYRVRWRIGVTVGRRPVGSRAEVAPEAQDSGLAALQRVRAT